ncbi:MAG: TolC family protein [Gammaproteobacteria bacterium]
MKTKCWYALIAFSFVFSTPLALAQLEENRALTTEELLASSEKHFPLILQSLAKQRAAKATVQEAAGAFDLVFESEGFGRLSGFYDGRAISGTVKQPLRKYGASLYGGYKLSEGDFPIYEDINFTNTGGTFKIGVLFSLLRDRDIDKPRFDVTDAELGFRAASLDILLTKIGVQQQALVAYWTWVANGRQLEIYENLLSLAGKRQKALERQVERGARAKIFLTENRQNILRRQSLVMAAGRDLELAANRLSFYYRDENGRPMVPQTSRLPKASPRDALTTSELPSEEATSNALTQRPELRLLLNAIERERNRIALRENALKPRLDLKLELQDGLGGVQEGGRSRDTTDTVVGFSFSVPLQQRSERGRLERSRAQLDAQLQAQQFKRDQIELEVRNLLLDLGVSGRLLVLAEREAELSELLRVAEVRRFESGASDFFLVNIREETAANNLIKLFRAELKIRIARANYDAATVDFERLGIDPMVLAP